MWPFGKRIESVFRVSYFFEAKALIINYENRVRGKIENLSLQTLIQGNPAGNAVFIFSCQA